MRSVLCTLQGRVTMFSDTCPCLPSCCKVLILRSPLQCFLSDFLACQEWRPGTTAAGQWHSPCKPFLLFASLSCFTPPSQKSHLNVILFLNPLPHACLMNSRQRCRKRARVGFNLAECRQVIWKEPWERAQFYYSVIRNKILLREENERWVLIL